MSVTNSYAKALFEAASESPEGRESMPQMEAQLDDFIAIINTSKELRVALEGPLTTSQEKVALVEGISKTLNFSPILKEFAVLLAKNARFRYLQEIRDTFSQIRLNAEGALAGRVVTAEGMTREEQLQLENLFSQKLGKRVAFQVSTDPSLLAGLKVVVNGVTYDGSLRSQIQRLRDRFSAGLSGIRE